MTGKSKNPMLIMSRPDLYGVGVKSRVAVSDFRGHSLSDLYYFIMVACITSGAYLLLR
ncbi:MAG: hypothetical protein HYZ71_14460 [Deltaproteobacteria bacterium]|nr:hypothetical protein [Deltaproteobacteria bacterium]